MAGFGAACITFILFQVLCDWLHDGGWKRFKAKRRVKKDYRKRKRDKEEKE